jgi:hypothetical protein
MTLAAGPDKMVSMGLSTTASAGASDPSPFTNMIEASIPSFCMLLRTAVSSLATSEMMRALSVAVRARRGASNASDKSLDMVTGYPVAAWTSFCTRSS